MEEIVDLDRIDDVSKHFSDYYKKWAKYGYVAPVKRVMEKPLPSLESEISDFLDKCTSFAKDDGDGTYDKAKKISRDFNLSPCRLAYAEQFDSSIRRKP